MDLSTLDYQDIAEKALAVFGILQLIARITPTKRDDKIVSKIGKVLNFLFSATNVKKGK